MVLIRNYIGSRENGKRSCLAKVGWSSLIQTQKMGGLKLLDLSMQMHALMVKLFIRGLTPGTAP